MARLVVRISDNSHPDPAINLLRTQIGDVVEVCEDGHWFSDGEVHCGQYRIVEVPGVPEAALAYLKEQGTNAAEDIILRRTRKVDVVALSAKVADAKAKNYWLGKPDIDLLVTVK